MTAVFFKVLSIYLALAVLLMSVPAQGWAMFIPSDNSSRDGDIDNIRKILESKIMKQRLNDLGLSQDQATARINKLSDEQIHRFASRLDSLQAGADTVDALIIVLLVAVLVVGILELTGHSIIIR